MGESKGGAYGKQEGMRTGSKFDLETFAARAKEKDKEAYEFAKEAEEAAKKGKKPPRRKLDLPKPTELLKAREGPLDLESNLNKTSIVNNPGGRGAGQPGFYCEVCKRVSKDSIAYLDHINGRTHLRRLGQTTQVSRSSLMQVRMRIAHLRAQTAQASASKRFDFEQRLKQVEDQEEDRRKAEREKKAEARAKKREEEEKRAIQEGGGEDMMKMMGFAGFK